MAFSVVPWMVKLDFSCWLCSGLTGATESHRINVVNLLQASVVLEVVGGFYIKTNVNI